MVLQESDYVERINALTKKDWQPLLKLIPEIENTKSLGKVTGGGIDEKGAFALPHMEPDEIVYEFREIVYSMPIMINFDWASWDEGRKMVSDENFVFDNVDIPIKCKIITAIVRNDRFCEDDLVTGFKSGSTLRILHSIKHQIATKNDSKFRG